jgi:uncharacterized protein with GYD domain
MKFVIFFTLQPKAIAGAMEHPSDRAAIVGGMLESVGGRLDAYYWMTGQFDGMVIGEVPEPKAAAAAALAVSSTGAFAHVETHGLIPADELQPLLDQAKSARASYTPIGS